MVPPEKVGKNRENLLFDSYSYGPVIPAIRLRYLDRGNQEGTWEKFERSDAKNQPIPRHWQSGNPGIPIVLINLNHSLLCLVSHLMYWVWWNSLKVNLCGLWSMRSLRSQELEQLQSTAPYPRTAPSEWFAHNLTDFWYGNFSRTSVLRISSMPIFRLSVSALPTQITQKLHWGLCGNTFTQSFPSVMVLPGRSSIGSSAREEYC